jgi:hypothetical protein
VQSIKAMRTPQKIRRRLARAADAADLDEFVLLYSQFVRHADDLIGNRIVATARTKRTWPSLVFVSAQTNLIGAWWHD